MVPASIFGYANGTAKGGSPNARVAAYKVCWPPINGSECFDADILAAFDMAIHDGVDVLSVSLGGPPSDYLNDGIAIGSFHAVSNGITVICSAGNDGPYAGSVSNVAPWILTVGASTIDRNFESDALLGNKKLYKVHDEHHNKSGRSYLFEDGPIYLIRPINSWPNPDSAIVRFILTITIPTNQGCFIQ